LRLVTNAVARETESRPRTGRHRAEAIAEALRQTGGIEPAGSIVAQPRVAGWVGRGALARRRARSEMRRMVPLTRAQGPSECAM
jgi:hypothetical protein